MMLSDLREASASPERPSRTPQHRARGRRTPLTERSPPPPHTQARASRLTLSSAWRDIGVTLVGSQESPADSQGPARGSILAHMQAGLPSDLGGNDESSLDPAEPRAEPKKARSGSRRAGGSRSRTGGSRGAFRGKDEEGLGPDGDGAEDADGCSADSADESAECAEDGVSDEAVREAVRGVMATTSMTQCTVAQQVPRRFISEISPRFPRAGAICTPAILGSFLRQAVVSQPVLCTWLSGKHTKPTGKNARQASRDAPNTLAPRNLPSTAGGSAPSVCGR